MNAINEDELKALRLQELAEILIPQGWRMQANNILKTDDNFALAWCSAAGQAYIGLWAPKMYVKPLALIPLSIDTADIIRRTETLIAEDRAWVRRFIGKSTAMRAAEALEREIKLTSWTVQPVRPGACHPRDYYAVVLPMAPEHKLSMAELHEHWEALRDVSVTEDGARLDEQFLHFTTGSKVEDVWHWFEAQNRRFQVADKHAGVVINDSY